MKIRYGLQSGAVLQRSPEGCDAVFAAEHHGPVRTSLGKIEPLGDGLFRLTDIPAGGPYSLSLSDDGSSLPLYDVYVGDVWVLAGQSNMEGVALRRQEEIEYDAHPNPSIRAFYFSDCWDAACSLLHEQWLNSDLGVREKYYRDAAPHLQRYGQFEKGEPASEVGPGHFIGLRMLELTGVPQGLIPCAFGGTSLTDWSPDNHTPASLYHSMLRRIRDCGGRARGMFWYQGENETNDSGVEHFLCNMERFISALRADLQGDTFPIVQAQLAHTALPSCTDIHFAHNWHQIKMLQWGLPNHIPHLSTVSTATAYLQDVIHIDAQSQAMLGKTMAEEMHRLLTGEGMAVPQLDSITVEKHPVEKRYRRIRIRFRNVAGRLISAGRPYGFSITLDDELPYAAPYCYLHHISLEGDCAVLLVDPDISPLERINLWHGAGFHCVCNITDEQGRALPAFGPVPLSSNTF